MGKCKGCGREIIWIMTPSGKAMPCDPDEVVYWEKRGAKGKVVTPNGAIISCEFEGLANTETGIGYVPHWATCPVAGQFKRRG